MTALLYYQSKRGAGIVRTVRNEKEALAILPHLRRPARLVSESGSVIGNVWKLEGPDALSNRKWGWWLDGGAV